MAPSSAREIVHDLRASLRFLALAAAVGGAAGLAGELVRPERSAASAVLLASAHTPDPDGFRRRPISVAELQAHLDPALLAVAAEAAHVAAGGFEVELSARSESGLYDVTAVSRDPAIAAPAATAVAGALAARLSELRERKAKDQLDPRSHADAAADRERAAAAYLADVASGKLEAATAAADRAAALAKREGFRLALDRSEARLHAEEEVLARARASALALEPAAEVYAPAGAVTARPRHPLHGAGLGASAGLFLALAWVLLLGAPRSAGLREAPAGRAAAS
jgi:hypothetical protein